MTDEIIIKEVPIEEAVKVNATVVEFGPPLKKEYFEERYKDKEKLIIMAYINNQPAGYVVGYDAFDDGSFYCWMTGVNPDFRRRGVLKALMNYEDKWAKENGYNKIRIKTLNIRREMLSFLVKHGYFFTDIEKHHDVEENKIFLEKKL